MNEINGRNICRCLNEFFFINCITVKLDILFLTPKTIHLVFVASPLSTQHSGERAKTGWLGIRIMWKWSDMYTRGLLFQLASTIKFQLSVLV
jgi:hypothetical protein